ncbi:indole-3-glycerol phosphate synthase [Salinibaculum rarum]|uniref:indole-3-glycerol phosphate synthase n=1 Tax=Salinibaculum rarum TaxID=3058903 RepID=UPI00265E844D|nr:indole-3-glycerol phosphate synthase [Salinibaculum sp. KK48]
MDANEEFAPAIRSILETARERGGGDERVDVEARSLLDAIEQTETEGRVPVIAEVKPTSPTTDGEQRADPVELAEQMVAGGATALSVLTEPEHFGGTPEDLQAVREAVDVPVLRKDFILREEQLDTVEADIILLIARFVDDLDSLLTAARERGFQVLVETHTESEVEQALAAGADIIGVNNRDLAKLEVDLATFERVSESVPESATLIAESGIGTTDDVARMREAGADALLIGSAIMAHDDAGGSGGDVETNTRRFTQA